MKHAHQMFKHLKFGRGKAEYVFQMERDQLQDLISENATKYKQLHRGRVQNYININHINLTSFSGI